MWQSINHTISGVNSSWKLPLETIYWSLQHPEVMSSLSFPKIKPMSLTVITSILAIALWPLSRVFSRTSLRYLHTVCRQVPRESSVTPRAFVGLIRIRSLCNLTNWLPDKQDGQAQSTLPISEELGRLVDTYDVAESFHILISTDGAGSWPLVANHDLAAWPRALRPYGDIYAEVAMMLPQSRPLLDDESNRDRIKRFRRNFRRLLRERIDLVEVSKVRAF